MSDKHKWLVLLLAGIGMLIGRHELESSMALHMAVQIPLLAILGGVLAQVSRQRYSTLAVFGMRYRTSLLFYALFTFSLWMLPRLLDAALHEPVVAMMKWLSLPLAGMALLLSWRHLPFVLRGLLHIEALAMLLRLGWLYLIAPQRYCVSYGRDDQLLLGYVLLCYGAIYTLLLAGRVMFGGGCLSIVADRRTV